jgi:hypothetical protein
MREPQPRSRICVQVLLLSSVLLLTACIVTYKDFPNVDVKSPPQPTRGFPIYFQVNPSALYAKGLERSGGVGRMFDPPRPSLESYNELERAFRETRMFAQAIAASSPPEKGIYCSVDVVHKWPSQMADAFTFGSLLSLTVFPSYSDTSQDIVQFDLYIDKKLKKVYQYRITKVRGMWIAFLPFVWINLLTPSREEAYRATAHQFFLDADKDGYISTY